MPSQEQVDTLKKGVEEWNQWREANPDSEIDLSDGDLRGANLKGANLNGANMAGAKLQFSNLSGAQLEKANLDRAKFQEVNMQNAQFPGAVVTHCNFMEANVQGANFEGADLSGSQFNDDVFFMKTNLKGTNLTDASGLHPNNIQGAILDKETILPEYLKDDLEDEDFLNSFL